MFPGRFFYLAVGSLAAIDIVWVALTPVSVRADSVMPVLIDGLLILGIALALKLLSHRQTVDRPALELAVILSEGMFFLHVSWIFMRLFNHLSMTTAFPWMDDWLMRVDRRVPLDWNAYFAFVATRPVLVRLLDLSYTSLTPLSVAAIAGLVLLNRVRAAELFIAALFTTAIICMLIGMFFPAKAAVATMLGDSSLLGAFQGVPGCYHIDHLLMLRGEKGPVAIDLLSMPGLLTFPSFHTAVGIIISASYRHTPLFWPATVYAAVMISATPVFGGHYFIDLPAGAAIAVAVLAAFGRLPRYRYVFAPRPVQALERVAQAR
jgi:hypothetical protein